MQRIAQTLVLGLIFVQSLSATEGGGSNYLPGFYGDFQMGEMPSEQGFYLSNMFSAYQNPKALTGNLLELPGIMYVTGKKFLGGDIAAGIWPALELSKDNTLVNQPTRLAFGDPYIMPISLSWQWGDFYLDVFEGVVAPVGYYKKNQLSIGSNIWTFDHNLASTLKLPANNEFSMDFGYMNNSQNPATHYTNGNELHFDYMLGHYFQNDFGLGLVGSIYRQVTADQAPAAILAKQYTSANSLGPVILFVPPIGKKEVSMSLKWLHEIDVQGRLTQDYIIWRVYSPF